MFFINETVNNIFEKTRKGKQLLKEIRLLQLFC